MHIGHFLSTGTVHHFLVKPGYCDPVEACRRMYQTDPQGFKRAIAGILENSVDDPGNRKTFIQLLPLVTGRSLTNGLDIYSDHQGETASHRNYLQLGETKCNGVGKWWAGITESDLRF